ncbi:acyl carrier protein [Psychroflexus gondwanensis]|uniref:acyl carrier protein n=1 Tax=Psychroflexus gondwanensis TaxID=251 RepID=UPI0011BE9831|nr:acyl carrier protein [Psychroflexus gondwanensis]TXE19203.1 acyl carrier protein [Psychroflexus gondwanensis]
MSNLDKLNKVFTEVFEVEKNQLGSDFSIDNVDNWDSVTQLSLVSDIEDEFDIMIDSDDILDFKSYDAAKVIIAKYEVNLKD